MINDLLKTLRPLVERVRNDVTAIKGDKGVAWVNEPLSVGVLRQHINGGQRRGVGLIKPGESTTRVAVIDLDSHKGESTWDEMAAAAEHVAGELIMRGLPTNPWRSGGGNGVHLILLWDEPQDAYSVRQELADALADCGFEEGTGGVAKGQVEIFPKQDSVAEGKFGNQFFLPLGGKSEPLVPVLGYDPGGREMAVGYQWAVAQPVVVREKPARAPITIDVKDRAMIDRALWSIPNDIDNRDDWFKLMCAAKEAGVDKEVARAWTAQHHSYKDEGFDGPWDSIEVGGDGAPAGYLFTVAERHGFTEHITEMFEVLEVPSADQPAVARRRIPEAQHLTTDQANAGRIATRFGKHLIVMAGQWFAWSGKRWERDDGEVYRCGCMLSKLIHAEADAWAGKKGTTAEETEKYQAIAEALRKWAQRSEMKASIEAALGLAKKLLAVGDDALDRNPWLLNCLNGTVDLRTGEIKPHDPADYITKLAPLEYDPAARSQAWETVVARVTLEEGMTTRPLARFLQRWFGYCATGSTREQAFVVHYGQGSNGKSTILDTVAEVLGDYASTAAPGLLVGSSKDRHPTEVADLFGRRMVTSHETGEGGQLKEDVVKQLTGSDKVKARFMRADFFEFDPTHKLQLLTNHKPAIRGQDNGIWRRVLLMPYLARFAVAEEVAAGRAHYVRDTRIAERLKAEYQGVLTWIVEGAKAWAVDGLQPPDAVLAASRDYQAEQDRIGQFIAECCELDPAATEVLSDAMGGLYSSYRSWCGEGGFMPLSKQRFVQELERCVPNFAKRTSKQKTAGDRRRDVLLIQGLRLLMGV